MMARMKYCFSDKCVLVICLYLSISILPIYLYLFWLFIYLTNIYPSIDLSSIYLSNIYLSRIRKVAEQCRLPKYKLFGYGLVSFLCCVKSATIQEVTALLCLREFKGFVIMILGDFVDSNYFERLPIQCPDQLNFSCHIVLLWNWFCILITFNNPLKVCFSNKRYLITIPICATQIAKVYILLENQLLIN